MGALSRGAPTLLAILAGTACAGEPLAPVTGVLEVSVNVAGGGNEPDGFLAVVEGSVHRALATGEATLVGGLAAGSHQVALEGISAN